MPEPVTRRTLGGLEVRAVGGADGRGGGDGPAVLLCHGFGAPGDDLVSLARVVDAGPGVRWFFPEAPIALDGPAPADALGQVGRAWWEIDMARLQLAMMRGDPSALTGETPAGLPAARALLEGAIRALESEHGVPPERLLLGGFSQGAMLATEVALHAERPLAALAVLSGTLLSEARWREAAKRSGPSIRALVTHGRRDPLLPFFLAEELAKLLGGAGARVTFVAHGGGHELPLGVLDALGKLAREALPVP